ncbi:hypothetical protein T4E_9483 [Trichinella pseudospiralis]|uniref:Integrase zinc-binding domain-containing protein n=1 Tax=Trichinella pseudospiralis TaxID=6337 RepID=A0A0V0XYX0_TRIPS|nr:hypothetical protein T4E_9483 [Trichinella pseudospiralis]
MSVQIRLEKQRLPDLYHDLFLILICNFCCYGLRMASIKSDYEKDYQNWIAGMRARLSIYMEEAPQLVQKCEDSLSTGKQADDITDWHVFEIEVVRARSLGEEYLEKDSVTDSSCYTTPNRGTFYHVNLFKWEFLTFDRFVLQFETFWEHDVSLETSRKFYDEIVLHIRALKALGKNPSSPEMRASEVLLEIFKLKMHSRARERVQESVSMSDRKPSSNVTVRMKSPSRKNLPSLAALHSETRSSESCVIGHTGIRCPEEKRCDYLSCGKTHHKLLHRNQGTPQSRTGETSSVKPMTEKVKEGSGGIVAVERYNGMIDGIEARRTHSKYEKLRCVNFCLKGIHEGEDSYPIEALCIDFYNRLLFKERIVGGDALPEAVNSPFGWILSGNIPIDDGSGKCITLLVKTENEYSEDDLRRFWDLEVIGVADDKGKEGPSAARLMKTFEETLEYNYGRYTDKLPWKPGFPNLPNNYAYALQRLLKTEASLLKEPLKKNREGPSLQSDLVRILLRLRRRHCVGEPGDPSPPKSSCFWRICFGLTSSPFLALVVMQHHARLYESMWPKSAEEVPKNIYVDDLLFSLDDRTETMECVKELKQLMETAGFHLTKWSSNEPSVMRSSPEEEQRRHNHLPSRLCSTASPTHDKERNVERDYGDFRPVGLSVTVLHQSQAHFTSTVVNNATQVLVASWNRLHQGGRVSEYGDASEMAYGSAIYLRATTVSHETVVKMAMSKTRIATDKRVTLPQLEVMAALITARLISFVKTSLEMKFWDSYRWKPFVVNRVESITELTDAQWWRHCPTTDNPADILTRVCRMKDLVSNNLWGHGSHWLTKCEDAWRMVKFEFAIDRNPEFQAEVGKSARELHTQTKAEPVLNPQKYSSLMKLFNVTAYVFRFITNCKAVPEERKTTPLDVREINRAEKFRLKALQNEEFPEHLESHKQEKKRSKSSRLWPLNPYVDDNGIRRLFVDVYDTLTYRSTLIVDQTLSCLRQRYWIINVHSIVKGVIKECVNCRKENAKPFLLKMRDLRKERVDERLPFENTGLDIAALRTHKKETLLARFIFASLRSQPRILQSDNFTSFKEIGGNLNELDLENHHG